MAGSIAHDFNNLFQALVVSLGIVEVKCADRPELRKPLVTAHEVLRRAIELSWKMLDFSGRASARLEPHGLDEVVASWAAHLERSPDLDLDPCPPVLADPRKLGKVLDSLLANAREAMEEAGRLEGVVKVKVFVASGEETAAPGFWVTDPPEVPGTVCLEFANDGPSPAPEVLARMFDPFFTTKALGRGLGLPSALGVLRAHGTSIQVLARVEEGLTFRFHFPPVNALVGEARAKLDRQPA
jgi:signal transduction histidine kinase